MEPVRRPTMVDVARQAGVALRTVSRVVNKDPTVGEDLAERVLRVIAELNYQPDEGPPAPQRCQRDRRGGGAQHI